MVRSTENILRRDYWLGEVDARLPALLRIALGALVTSDLADRLRDFHAFYAPGGILPGPGEGAQAGLAWSLFALAPSRAAVLALFLAGFPLAVAFMLGYRARLASVLLWVFMVSLQNRNTWIVDGGDGVLQALLFWSMFVDTGAALSLDVRLGRRSPRDGVPAFAFRVLQLQVAFVYLVTFLAKTGDSWRDGSAVLRAVQSSDWGRGLAPLLAQHPSLAAALTYATLAIEGAFPLLVLSPLRPELTRAVAIASGLALHLGIFLTMRVGIFSQVMPIAYLVFVPVAWIAWAKASFARLSPSRGARDPVRVPNLIAWAKASFARLSPSRGARDPVRVPNLIAWAKASFARLSPSRGARDPVRVPNLIAWAKASFARLSPSRGARDPVRVPNLIDGPARVSVAARVAAGLLAAQFALIVLDDVARARQLSWPSALSAELALVGQRQSWRMFAPDAPLYDITWRLPGELGDGRRVDLGQALLPELTSQGGFTYSRWRRLRNSLSRKAPALLMPLGRYVCRRWEAAHPETPLVRFEIVARVRPTLGPASAAPDEQIIFRQACRGAP